MIELAQEILTRDRRSVAPVVPPSPRGRSQLDSLGTSRLAEGIQRIQLALELLLHVLPAYRQT